MKLGIWESAQRLLSPGSMNWNLPIACAPLAVVVLACSYSHSVPDDETGATTTSRGSGYCTYDARGVSECVGGDCAVGCCVDHMFSTCTVPEGYECGIAPAEDCGDGTCADPWEGCGLLDDGGPAAPPDAGPPPEGRCMDIDGVPFCVAGPCSHRCCVDGVLSTCALPEGERCDTPLPIHCGSGTCVAAGETCPST